VPGEGSGLVRDEGNGLVREDKGNGLVREDKGNGLVQDGEGRASVRKPNPEGEGGLAGTNPFSSRRIGRKSKDA